MKRTKDPAHGDTRWFTHDRFGLFIHWGLYALPARHEWVQHQEEIPGDTYQKYFRHFDPDLYDPKVWAAAAANAGMKYFVVTTKHHEGFCLWDTKQTDFKATNTPAGRDLLRPMLTAFREQQLRVGLYHSLIDWHHPDYVIDPHIGPLRNSPDRAKLNKARSQARYAKYLHAQVREILTQFGQVDVLWFDYSFPKPDGSGKGHADWDSEKLIKLVRQLQPHIVMNDRLDWPTGWDFKTPEQRVPREGVTVAGQPVVWEACHTFSGSWGYHRDEASWKSVEQLVHLLIDSVSKGGNLLLNVGPTGRGEFDDRALQRLAGIGEWMKRHSRSIDGCTQAPADFTPPPHCDLTYNPQTQRLYIHTRAWPYRDLYLDGAAGQVEYAQLLHDASEIILTEPVEAADRAKKTLRFHLPMQKPNVTVPVIELFLKKPARGTR